MRDGRTRPRAPCSIDGFIGRRERDVVEENVALGRTMNPQTKERGKEDFCVSFTCWQDSERK